MKTALDDLDTLIDYLTNYLCEVGIDNSEVTSRGKVIESIINKLYILKEEFSS